MMTILRYSKFFLALSVLLVAASLVCIALFGLELGIEFTGGSILEVAYEGNPPSLESIRSQLSALNVGLDSVQRVGDNGLLLRMKAVSEEDHQAVLASLGEGAQELRFESIGPVIGKELRGKSAILLALALGAIILYVMFAFRKVKQPVHAWQWSLATLVALLHDILIPLGVLALLGEYYGVQITIPVVVALLTVVGYSVNDTVVVFDRVRENIIKKVGVDFADTVRQSLAQTFTRSLNTSLTTLLAVLAIVFFGGETLRYFALTMAIGIGAGSWSSLFLAPALLTDKRKFGLIL
jgi:preprotein translocase subunit SecF